MADDNLSVEILDYNWTRKAFSPNAIEAEVTDILGEVGDATVTIPADDLAIYYIPDQASQQSIEARFRIYEGDTSVFAGVVDSTQEHAEHQTTPSPSAASSAAS